MVIFPDPEYSARLLISGISKLLGAKCPKPRLTLTADNPLTVFKYHGFTPEVANGIDSQT